MKLTEGKIGVEYLVNQVSGNTRERSHLLEMGLLPGSLVTINKRAPMGDPIELRLHGYELAIRVSQADQIEVEEHNDNKNAPDRCVDSENLYDLGGGADCKNCRVSCRFNPNIGAPKFTSTNQNTAVANKIQGAHNPAKDPDDLLNETKHPGLGEPGRFHNKNDENPLPDNHTIRFALVGNQNCGKTTLFNQLTGSNQHVGNFPGVTVERKDGTLKDNHNTKVTDLPGVYSLSPYSKEEDVTRQFVLSDELDCIINIVDATSIERSLYLTMQCLELDIPMVVALNMIDELAEGEGSILINELEFRLGVPVVPISAKKNQGIDELCRHAMHVAKYQELPLQQDFCQSDDRGGAVHRALHAIMHCVEDHAQKYNVPRRFAASMLAIHDGYIQQRLRLDDSEINAINTIIEQMESETGMDCYACIADMRYRFILRVVAGTVKYGKKDVVRDRTSKADKILTGKWTAIPAFILIMGLVFWLTFGVIGSFLQELLETGIEVLAGQCSAFMQSANVSEVIQSLVEDGVFSGVGSVLSFLPIIVVLFFFLSILEDSGYMARIAFVMDKLLRKIGLSGRSIVPMLIGFGCSVPAIMATRTLPSDRDRKLTILLTPFMSCSAKLPIYAFISAIFFPEHAPLVMICLYLLGIVIGVLIALILSGKGEPVPFIMELPNYRLPTLKNVGHLLWDKCGDFLKRAFTIILIATLIIWFMQHFTFQLNFVDNAEGSMLAIIAGFIAPIFNPIGLGDWRITTSLITGFLAKESVVATMSVLYGGAASIAVALTHISALTLLVFCLLYTPCVAAIASVRRELGWLPAIGVVVFQCVVAYAVAYLVFLIGSLVV